MERTNLLLVLIFFGSWSSSVLAAFVCNNNNVRAPQRFQAEMSVDAGDASSAVTTASLEAPLQGALAKMNQVMTANCFQSQPALKQLYGKSTKSVVVKDSSIPGAGKGLFATKNIKAGTIVSFYPAHTLGVELGEQQLWVSTNDSDREYFAQNPPSTSSYLHATDQPIFNRPSILADTVPELKDAAIYLDVNPNRDVDPLWLSQYINDGAVVTRNDEVGVTKYYEQSKKKKNCIHIPFGPSPIMATVATRKIKKGEEIYTMYGCVYWLGLLYEEQGPDMTDQIQQQIKDSATDLFKAMKSASVTYGNQVEALQRAYNEL